MTPYSKRAQSSIAGQVPSTFQLPTVSAGAFHSAQASKRNEDSCAAAP